MFSNNISKAPFYTFFVFIFCMPLMLSAQDSSFCPDVEGYEEHPVLKRYNNSCVIGFNEVKYERASLPIEQQINGTDTKHLVVEGKIKDIVFAIENKSKATVLEVQRNYEMALKNSEMQILYSCSGSEDCFKYGGNFPSRNNTLGDVRYIKEWEHQKMKYFRFAFSRHNSNLSGDDAYFLAQGKKNNKKYTIALFIRYNRTSWEDLNGNIFVFAKIIEEDIMDTDQVTVAAIDDKIKNEGKKVFTNIHFEFGSAQLTEASYPIIDLISQYLKGNPTEKYYIVGHTDNVGSLESNQKLSEARAMAVRTSLINKYQVDANQITSHGVGQLSPSVANTTEENRALNRRVEIVIR